jgi:hypothetical protein
MLQLVQNPALTETDDVTRGASRGAASGYEDGENPLHFVGRIVALLNLSINLSINCVGL